MIVSHLLKAKHHICSRNKHGGSLLVASLLNPTLGRSRSSVLPGGRFTFEVAPAIEGKTRLAIVNCGEPTCVGRADLPSALSPAGLSSYQTSSSGGTNVRIVGGDDSEAGRWPSAAALYRDGTFACGATILDQRWILTAGHCVFDFKEKRIMLQVLISTVFFD